MDEERLVCPLAPPPLPGCSARSPPLPTSSPSNLSCLGSASLLPPGSHRPHKLIRHLSESSADSEAGRFIESDHDRRLS